MTYAKPSDAQVDFAIKLLREREYPEWGATSDERLATFNSHLAVQSVDRFELMGVIDYLKVAPLDTESGLPIGVYQHEGEIFVVKLNRAKTNKYALRLVELGGSARRLNEPGDHVPIDFVYAPGMLSTLTPEDQMSLEDAKPFIIKYGRCLFCGQFLRAAKSVERSVGPVCIKRYLGDNGLAEATTPPATGEQVTDWLAALGG